MKKLITPTVSFILGATIMYICIPSEPKPVAELIVWTTKEAIHIPLLKDDAKIFMLTGTNQLVINGISVKALP
jgi:hypothetical protein